MIVLNKPKFFLHFFSNGIKNRYLYTSPSTIKHELDRRKKNTHITNELLELIRPTPELRRVIDTPHIVFFRQVATPLNETLRVVQLASELQLPLCIFEYHKDKFVGAHNPFKHGLGKMPIHQFVSKNGTDVYENQTVVDFNRYTGERLQDVKTLSGENLIDFHHNLFKYATGINVDIISIDCSPWFAQFSYDAEKYYDAFLSIFIQHSVLAEIFLLDHGDEEPFTKQVVTPAFERVRKRFKYKPLILNYLPDQEQTRQYWNSYPTKVGDFLKKQGYIK